jgi:hypothetical protein
LQRHAQGFGDRTNPPTTSEVRCCSAANLSFKAIQRSVMAAIIPTARMTSELRREASARLWRLRPISWMRFAAERVMISVPRVGMVTSTAPSKTAYPIQG